MHPVRRHAAFPIFSMRAEGARNGARCTTDLRAL
jgi:hypothetical protein